MTVEQVNGCITADKKLDSVSEAVEELLKSAQTHDCLTVGVYESAKLMMNIDPDSVLLCILAMDEEDEGDIALQIHFTLIQAFCYENNTDILRVSGLTRLEQLLLVKQQPGGGGTFTSNANQPRDLHCLLVTSSQCQREDIQQQALLQSISKYCEESRSQEQWVPYLALQEESSSQDLSGKDTDTEAECHNNNNNNSGTLKAHVNEKNVPGAGLSVCLSVS